MKKVIVFFGESGSGKSTMCQGLREGRDSAIFNFADKVKQVTHEVFGIPKDILWGTKEQKDTFIHQGTGKTARYLMQWVGQSFREGPGGTTVWVDALINDVLACESEFVFIGDGRHPEDELHYFKKELAACGVKAFGVRLVPEFDGYEPFQGEAAAHPSEANVAKADMSQFDFTIHNNGSLDDFLLAGEQVMVRVQGQV